MAKRVLNPAVKGGFSKYVQKELTEGEKKTLHNARRSKDLIQLNKERKAQGLPAISDKNIEQKTREFLTEGELASGSAVIAENILTKSERDQVEAGMSIPEMKLLAEEKKIVIPKSMKKKGAIASHLLANGTLPDSDLL